MSDIYTTRFLAGTVNSGDFSSTYTVPAGMTASVKCFSALAAGSGSGQAILALNGIGCDSITLPGENEGDVHSLTIGLVGGDELSVYANDVEIAMQVSGFLFQ